MELSKYELYDAPGADEAEVEFDAFFEEVREFMHNADDRLMGLMTKHDALGARDREARGALITSLTYARKGLVK